MLYISVISNIYVKNVVILKVSKIIIFSVIWESLFKNPNAFSESFDHKEIGDIPQIIVFSTSKKYFYLQIPLQTVINAYNP